MNSAAHALELADVRRTFLQGGEKLDVLRGMTLAVAPGEMVALVGPSGSGKSTLLHVAGLLERPDAGEVRIAGEASNFATRVPSAATSRSMSSRTSSRPHGSHG